LLLQQKHREFERKKTVAHLKVKGSRATKGSTAEESRTGKAREKGYPSATRVKPPKAPGWEGDGGKGLYRQKKWKWKVAKIPGLERESQTEERSSKGVLPKSKNVFAGEGGGRGEPKERQRA